MSASAYKWPTANTWYCGHCGTDLGQGNSPKVCPDCDIKHAYMIEKTEYLDIHGAPFAKGPDGAGAEKSVQALPASREERPATEELPPEA